MSETRETSTNSAARETISGDALSGLKYRNIGPHRGGRVVAVAGHPRDPMVFYFGACAGGVWKTTDGRHALDSADGYATVASCRVNRHRSIQPFDDLRRHWRGEFFH